MPDTASPDHHDRANSQAVRQSPTSLPERISEAATVVDTSSADFGTNQHRSPEQFPERTPRDHRSDLVPATSERTADKTSSSDMDLLSCSGPSWGEVAIASRHLRDLPDRETPAAERGDPATGIVETLTGLRALHARLVDVRKRAPRTALEGEHPMRRWSLLRAEAFVETAEATLWTAICTLDAELGVRP